MKKNMYYRRVFQRRNALTESLLSFFLALASYPRMLIEVFIRKNFGERYFNLFTAWSVSILLVLTNLAFASLMSSITGTFFLLKVDWILLGFIAVFMVHAYRREREINRNPSSFDFMKFTKYTGDIHPYFKGREKIGSMEVNPRNIEILFEPAPFFLAGLVLFIIPFSMLTGLVLIVSAAFYSLSYVAAYAEARNQILDKIDEMIANEEMYKVFVEDEESSRGFRWIGPKPGTEQNRDKLYPYFFEDIEKDQGERAA